ncbi:MAG: 7-carboxy-7-deazaguanine synthase QueE [Catalinimonas sp.]
MPISTPSFSETTAAPHGVAALPLMEAFYTLQGEGMHQGRAAYFIRLGGCDVGCHWCDVKDSWDVSRHPHVTIGEIVAEAARHPARLAVVTGGEPLMHNLDELTGALRAAGFRTHVETSGAHPMSGTWDWVCLSPKKFKAACEEAFAAADELKVVVYHPSDLAWAEAFVPRVGSDCHLLLQPEWDRRARAMPLILDYVRAHPHWRASLQTHKYLEIP